MPERDVAGQNGENCYSLLQFVAIFGTVTFVNRLVERDEGANVALLQGISSAFIKENMMSEDNANKHTAFVVMDVQRIAVAYIGDDHAFLNRLAEAIDTARKVEMRVIYVRARFREGYPEISPHNRLFSAGLSSGRLTPADLEIHPAITPQSGEVVVTKLRASAFTGSDFEVILRSQAISHLVLCGIATSGVVLSTLLEAADKDYELTVLSDCCGDANEEVQRVLTTRIFPRYAEVITVEEWKQKTSI